MVTGSYSAALKGEAPESFDYRQEFPDLDLATNIGVDKSVDLGIKTVEAMAPVFLQLHVNLMQELLMPEGERIFHTWKENVAAYASENRLPPCTQGGRLWYGCGDHSLRHVSRHQDCGYLRSWWD
mgnify:CR=1 FL=1